MRLSKFLLRRWPASSDGPIPQAAGMECRAVLTLPGDRAPRDEPRGRQSTQRSELDSRWWVILLRHSAHSSPVADG